MRSVRDGAGSGRNREFFDRSSSIGFSPFDTRRMLSAFCLSKPQTNSIDFSQSSQVRLKFEVPDIEKPTNISKLMKDTRLN